MRVKSLLKQIVPPVLQDVYRAWRRVPIWEGIHQSFGEVPTFGAGFATRECIGWSVSETSALLDQSDTIPRGITGHYKLLPLLASIVSDKSGRPVRILDIGGGAGVAYVRVLKTGGVQPDYDVVELDWAREVGTRLFPDDHRIRFHTQLPQGPPPVDIVQMDGVLQYVEDYRGLLEKVGGYGAPYIFLLDLRCGDIATFASAQKNMPGSSVPCWFFNLNEIVGILQAGGYSLIFKTAIEEQPSFSNEPDMPRMISSALLFSRAEARTQS